MRDESSGAEGGTRTHTELPPMDFKSIAYTNSATSAYCAYILLYIFLFFIQGLILTITFTFKSVDDKKRIVYSIRYI
jgi:hypothetical protein